MIGCFSDSVGRSVLRKTASKIGLPVSGEMYFLANSTREGELSIPIIFLAEYAWATAAVMRPIGPHPLQNKHSSVPWDRYDSQDGQSLVGS